MFSVFSHWNHTLQAFCATLFTWGISVAGATAVLFTKRAKSFALNATLGVAAGVMIAASFWSLLNPAVALCEELGIHRVAVPCLGFLAGGFFLFLWDMGAERFGKISDSKRRQMMLFTSVTLHNIPEGLAVGVAFGCVGYGLNGANFTAACMVALGIGLQNFPEGAAVSMPLRRDGFSPAKAFAAGILSGAVEPIAGILGAVLALQARQLLPFLLCFAAGAMIYVAAEELLPECQSAGHNAPVAMCTMGGFCLMTALDVGLG